MRQGDMSCTIATLHAAPYLVVLGPNMLRAWVQGFPGGGDSGSPVRKLYWLPAWWWPPWRRAPGTGGRAPSRQRSSL